MASKYKRTNSSYWWINFKDATGKRKDISSRLRWDDPQQTKKCDAKLALTTAAEFNSAALNRQDFWDSWVETYFTTCGQTEKTVNGYRQSWFWLRTYLAEKGISTPSQMSYKVGFEFLAWRKTHGIKKTTKDSTAQRDIKVLRLLMSHAVKMEMTQGNPLLRMGVKRAEHSVKEEFTDDDLTKLYAAFAKHSSENDWRYIAFRIASETGCRLSETQIPWKNINFENNTIFFEKPKGGLAKGYTTILPTSLRPLLERIVQLGGKFTCELPPNASNLMNNLIKRVAGLRGHSFHCTRVTFNTRLERNPEISGRVAMRALNHTSAQVHAVYQRHDVEDLRQIDGKVVYPAPPVFENK